MYPNARGSELFTLLATIDPASQAAGTVTTGWIPAGNHIAFLALLETGALGTNATVDAKLQQATDSSGTSAKDISGKAVTQLTQAEGGSNRQVLINLRPEELDTNAGFTHFRLSVTVATAASVIAAQVAGVSARFLPADTLNQSAVSQVL